LAFSPDGRTLVSGSMDTTALVWDVPGRGDAKTPVLSEDRLRALWDALGSPDAGEAGRAVWALAADPARSVPFLVAKLRDPPAAEVPPIPRLITDLGGANFKAREAAEKQLEALGKRAEPALREVLAGSAPLETRRRIEKILTRREAPIQAPDLLRSLRGIEALECAGGPEARRGLDAVARHAAERYFREEAKAAAERLGKRSPGPTP
jgi:hypothetical protein